MPLLAPLPEKELEGLVAGLTLKKYAQGEKLVTQGMPGNSFYIIEDGKVEVVVRDSEERETKVAELGEGKFFGEMSLLTGEARSATIRAMQDVDVLVIGKRDLGPILRRNPTIAEALSRVIEQRQLENLEKIAKTRKLSEEERLAASSASILGKIKNFFGLG